VDDNNFNLYLNYFTGSTKVAHKTKAVCSKLKVAMAVEISRCNNIVFVAGSDTYDIEKGRPVISAITFDEQMNELCTLELSEESMHNIYSIKRIPGTNTLLVSGEKSISIIEFCSDRGLERKSMFVELK
jgi:hypothetical protein